MATRCAVIGVGQTHHTSCRADVSIAVNTCVGMRVLKSAAVSVAYLLARMPMRAADAGVAAMAAATRAKTTRAVAARKG